jgi:DNA-binding LacI/PurR family transcriptional regulator
VLVHYGVRTGPGVTPEHEAGLEAALKHMLELPAKQRPTAIFSTFDPDAELIYLTLNKLGYRVPADISLISVGAVWRHSEITRRLTSVTADEGYAARTAVELLDRMCSERVRMEEEVRLTIPLSVYSGETVQPIPA